MRIEPCPACGKPIDLDDECRHLPDPPDANPDLEGIVLSSVWGAPSPADMMRWDAAWTYPSDHR